MLPFAGCINEFIPKDIREESGLLIIDGTITDGESVFTLSRSVGISEKLSEEAMINHAVVTVESNDGARIPAAFGGEGRYTAQTGHLDANLQYRLSVEVDGETFQSEYLSPIITAEIDSVFLTKEGKGAPVLVRLSANGGNGSKYYRWKYRETWEVKAERYADARWNDGPGEEEVIFHTLHTSQNTYYCWGRDSSKTLLLGDTEKLSQNIISQQTIAEIPCNHDKFSILYHIEAEQMQLREAAYRYLSDMQERAERTGDLFSPVLSAGLRGNIRCAGDPERLAIGYIDVSTTTRKDRYVWEREGFYEPPQVELADWGGRLCSDYSWTESHHPPILVYRESTVDVIHCVDCREKEHASKNKPVGWPTEHL
ncbi:MAG: DUF4249 domain-containing protein [Tannerellaceae bacterium]|nr:DUF4249 domain-containing protein [Tannerellaceae bacterium]